MILQFFSDFYGHNPQHTATANPWILNGEPLEDFASSRFKSKFLNAVNGPCVAMMQGAKLVISKDYFENELDKYTRAYLKAAYCQMKII